MSQFLQVKTPIFLQQQQAPPETINEFCARVPNTDQCLQDYETLETYVNRAYPQVSNDNLLRYCSVCVINQSDAIEFSKAITNL